MRARVWDPWNLVAFDQDSVLSRKQARAAGLSEDAWQWKLDDQEWRTVLPGVVTTHSGVATLNQELWACVLRIAPGAALTGDAALVATGFRMNDLRYVDVARSGAAGTTWRLPSGRLLRPMTVPRLAELLAPGERPPRLRAHAAVLHAAELASTDRAAEWRLAAAVQQGLARPADIRQSLFVVRDLEREPLIRTALDDIELGAHAMSELDFLSMCRRFGLPEPDELQVKVRVEGTTRYLDGRYVRQRVRFEVDGTHHRWVEVWEDDLMRGNELAIATRGSAEIGLRFSGSQVRHESERVATMLRAVL